MKIQTRVLKEVELETSKIDLIKEVNEIDKDINQIIYPIKTVTNDEYFLLLEIEQVEKGNERKDKKVASLSKKTFTKPQFSSPFDINQKVQSQDRLFQNDTNNKDNVNVKGTILILNEGFFYLIEDSKRSLVDKEDYLQLLSLNQCFRLEELTMHEIKMKEVESTELSVDIVDLDSRFDEDCLGILGEDAFGNRDSFSVVGREAHDRIVLLKLNHDQRTC